MTVLPASRWARATSMFRIGTRARIWPSDMDADFTSSMITSQKFLRNCLWIRVRSSGDRSGKTLAS